MNRNVKYLPFSTRATFAAVAVIASVVFYGVSKSGNPSSSGPVVNVPANSINDYASSSTSGVAMSHAGTTKNYANAYQISSSQ